MPRPVKTSVAPARRPRKRPAPAPVRRVEVTLRPDVEDPVGHEALGELQAAGLEAATGVRTVRVFFLEGAEAKDRGGLSRDAAERAAREVLSDPVVDVFAVDAPVAAEREPNVVLVTVTRKPGVTSPEAESARATLRSIGVPVARVQVARVYRIAAPGASPDAVLAAASAALGNEVVEDVLPGSIDDYRFPHPGAAPVVRRDVPVRALDGPALERLSASMGLALSRAEMEAVAAHFRGLRREPSDLELETIAQTWSEHCKHKTLTGPVEHEDERGSRRFDSLLRETIFEATKRLRKPWCLSVFRDNAGVIAFDDEDAVCMKVETHNHPSAIEPYGGAGTGIGGVIRDVLGTGLGARPVASTDVFCFGPPDLPADRVPRGALHPRRLLRGVVAGVRDYGNRMGIPTVNGAIAFDPRYVGNPVVFCGCVGILPRSRVAKGARPGDRIVAFGGRTGRDGIHGATFSSAELHAESETVSSGAVQIGDPVTEKKVLDVVVRARDLGLFRSLTDCGAGGFSSAVGEMAAETGAEVDLSKAPLKYPGLRYDEVWISEAQERMVAAVPPAAWPRLRALCAAEDVEAVVLGRFTDTGRLVVRHGRTKVGDLSMAFLHDGLPKKVRRATFRRGGGPESTAPDLADATPALLALLRSPDVGSKEWVVRQYDHEVQAGAVVRPLVGRHDGPSDAAVIAPKLSSRRGVVLSNGLAPRYGDVDPYAMAWAAVDEALRNAVAVGGSLARLAILDNFTWGSCEKPDRLGALVRAAEGCRDAALHYRVPFVSGKDSLNNEFRTEDGTTIAVPHTLLISAIGVVRDVRKTVTMDAKEPGDLVYLVGETHDECGGGQWYRLAGLLGTNVPLVRPGARAALAAVESAIARGQVRAAHDLSDGGLAVAAAEMAFAGGLGLDLDLAAAPGTTTRVDRLLFSETTTRLLLEVPRSKAAAFEKAMRAAKVPVGRLGRVTEDPTLVVRSSPSGRAVLAAPLDDLRAAWRDALPFAREEEARR